jgi:hypothetical protein
MPKVKISEYSATANSNTDVASINIDEGCAPSGINNAIRAVMGHLKDFQQGTNGDPFNGPVNGTLGATTASTANVTTLTTSSTVTHNGGTANGVAYLNGSKVLTTGSALVFDGSNLGVGVTPSAWASGYKAIQLTEGVAFSEGGGNTYLSNNWFYDGTNKYIANGTVAVYAQSGGTHAWYTAASGTAGNVISFTQAMTLDASGNLGIGTTSPVARLHVTTSAANATGTMRVINTSSSSSAYSGFYLGNDTSETDALMLLNSSTNTAYGGARSLLIGTNSSSPVVFITGANERARIDSSGNLLVGTTTLVSPNSGFAFAVGDGSQLAIGHLNATTGTYYAYFNYNGSVIGSITQNGTTGVLYNLTSDYRLKNDQQALTGAKDFIMALKPKKWQWWDGSGEGVGFVAHEFMEVAKYSGHGEKDAVDSDGKPVYQSIQPSSSEVMANLVAFIQELKAEFDAYKASHP